VVDLCLEREDPALGPVGAFMVVPGRRRGCVALVTSLRSSDCGEGLGCLEEADDGRLIVLVSGCWSCSVVEASRRALVSLGSDMADRGGDRGYISKPEAMGPGEIGGSSGDADEES
jgi:hypothetical protein